MRQQNQLSPPNSRINSAVQVPPFTPLSEALEALEAKSYCIFQTTMSTYVPLKCGHKEEPYNYKGRGICKHETCKAVRDAEKQQHV